MANELTIIKSENIQTIVKETPQNHQLNVQSRDKCVSFGQRLLAQIQQHGMTDELDQQAANYIDAARKTVKKMNERRAPLTKLFDQIRTEFTGLENEIDPTKAGTLPNQLQQLRNQYAARKREEEERRRREEMARQQHEAALAQYRNDLENDWRSQLADAIQYQCNDMNRLFASVNLDNYEIVKEQFRTWKVEMPAFSSNVMPPYIINNDEASAIYCEVWNNIEKGMREQYTAELTKYRDSFIDRMPSKKRELERAAQASAEEAERIRREMEERDRAEAARQEAERKAQEQRDREAAEMRKKQAKMGSLFDQQATATMQPVVEGYKPKTSVKQKLVPLAPEAFAEIFNFWWVNEGQHLSIEDLTKLFKKQITYCEKRANDKTNPVTIKSELISYEDDVRAK